MALVYYKDYCLDHALLALGDHEDAATLRRALQRAISHFTKDPEVARTVDDLMCALALYYAASHRETPGEEAKDPLYFTAEEKVFQEEAHMNVTASLHALLAILGSN